MAGTKVTADVITDASITVDKVHSQFKTASALGSSATVNVDWVAPIAYPSDGQSYEWNEETQSWDLMTE